MAIFSKNITYIKIKFIFFTKRKKIGLKNNKTIIPQTKTIRKNKINNIGISYFRCWSPFNLLMLTK